MSVYSDTVLADNPVAYWRLDDSGNTYTDSSGHGHTGTGRGTGAGNTHVGPLVLDGGAVSMPGFNSLTNPNTGISVPSSSAFDFTTAFSVEAWALPIAGGSAGPIVYRLSTSGPIRNQIMLEASSDSGPSSEGFQFYFFKTDGSIAFVEAPIATTALPRHVAATYDGTTARLYVDGVLRTSTVSAGSMRSSTFPLTIGFSDNTSGSFGFLKGTVDEVAIYDTVLSPTRILAHYEAGLTVPKFWTGFVLAEEP